MVNLIWWHKIQDGKSVARERKGEDFGASAIGPDGNPVWRKEVEDPRPDVRHSIETATKEIRIEPTTVRIAWVVVPRPIKEIKHNLSNDIDGIANSQRGLIGNEGASKQAEYDQIADEARKRVIGNLADEEAIILKADVDAGLAVDLDDAAAKVLAAADSAKADLAAVRFARRNAKAELDKVTSDPEAAWAIFSEIVWPK